MSLVRLDIILFSWEVWNNEWSMRAWVVNRIEEEFIFCWKRLNGSIKSQEDFGQDFSFRLHKKESEPKACWKVVHTWLKETGEMLISDTSCNAPRLVSVCCSDCITASRFSTISILTLEKFPKMDRRFLRLFHENRFLVKCFLVQFAAKNYFWWVFAVARAKMFDHPTVRVRDPK